MNRPVFRFAPAAALLALGLGVPGGLAQTPQAARPAAATSGTSETAAPAKNWVLPLFSPKEGFRTMTLRGSEVRPVGTARVDVTDLNITVFSGDAAARVETLLLSPSASFFAKEKRATGEKSVRLIRDDIEVTGEGWVYLHDTKTVSLARNVRVVFTAQLNDILK
ncbi:MAG: hypothetical protein NTV51_25865 [Verrucomicrobia bacterium]|nr:hypothetical protein [Verrucomicrobiota bacterium]